MPAATSGAVSTKTVTERVAPGGSERGGERAAESDAVGVGVQIHSGPSGVAEVMVTGPPAPGPARMVEKSENVIGPVGRRDADIGHRDRAAG